MTDRIPDAGRAAGSHRLRALLVLGSLLALTAPRAWAAGQALFEENFDRCKDGAALSELGWRVVSSEPQSTYTVRSGRLHVRCQRAPYHGGFAEVAVPVCRRGVLEFDANVAIEGAGNADGIGLTLDLYNISTFWHDYCRDWRRYFPEPVAKRMPGFTVEPVGHKSIGKVEKGQWAHYKVYFDTDKDRVEYYIGNLPDPCYVEGEAPVLGRSEYQGGCLRIGSFGLMKGPVVYALDNLVLRGLDQAEEPGPAQRRLALLFQGVSFPQYNLKPALLAAGLKETDLRVYMLDFWRAAPYPENMFKLDQLPGSDSLAGAKAIILVDMPAGPNQILPDFLLRDFAQQVHDGAHLVVLGGLFTLGKGRFQNTVMEKILPVTLDGKWEVRVQKEPLPVVAASAKMAGIVDWSARPAVYGLHQVEVKPEAEVLLKAGDRPLLVRQRLGRGLVTVFLGTTCGEIRSGPPALWQWQEWPRLASFLALSDGAP